MNINTMYKNIDHELGKIFPNELVKIIRKYYCYKSEYNPVQTYDKVLSTVIKVSHDGYDYVGPESYLHDLYILYKLDGKKYVALWHRENWFQNSEEDDLYYITKIITLDDFMKDDYKYKNIKIKFTKFLETEKS